MAKQRTFGWLLWVLLVGLLLVTQWTTIKMAGYRVFGIEPPKDNIPWRTDYSAALDEAGAAGKLVLLDFSADWCPPCQMMKHEVWPDGDVAAAVEARYIPVYLDVDAPSSAPAAERYGVRTIPSIIITDAHGNVLKQGGPMDADEMVAFLESASPS